MYRKSILAGIAWMSGLITYGQAPAAVAETDSASQAELTQDLREITVTRRRPGIAPVSGALNGVRINKEELFKAACCNLGESFSTSPSVDVSYDDAATGARQIKLLGLSGTYVQMLTENLPNFRGAAAPYALGYVPGTWMKSIQVSKGASSVRNGYESITGQIDVEYLKPEDEQETTANLYGNSEGRVEANAAANLHISPRLSTELLAHYEDNLVSDMDDNGDGFLDKPNVRQVNLHSRWHWTSGRYIFHGGLALLNEERQGGQLKVHAGSDLFRIGLSTRRYEGYMKHAFILNPEHGTNIALMGNVSMHRLDGTYGHKSYDVNQKNAYAQLLLETNLGTVHNLSLGVSLNHDYLDQHYNLTPVPAAPTLRSTEQETTPGAYVQHTLNLSDRLIVMTGLRADHSSQYGTFLTPRLHVRYNPSDIVHLRLSAGKGYRTVHALAENNYLLASGRRLVISPLAQESAWNYGISSSFRIPLFGNTLRLNAEYYYTRFGKQAIVDYDTDPQEIRIANLDGKSYSHTFQIDATYPLLPGLEVTAAYRLNDVKATYAGRLMEKPLTGKYKGLLTASYKTPLGLWQFDATLQLNGGGRMPTPYTTAGGTPSWDSRYPAYAQLNAQVTRWFRHFSVYVGGENLTGYRQHTPILSADQPWSPAFEPTLVWGPVSGAMLYAGLRVSLGSIL